MSTNKNTIFRFPFDVNPKLFLGLALLFFILTIKSVNTYIFPRVTPTTLSKKIEKSICQNVELFKSVCSDSNLITSISINKSSQKQINFTEDLPFAFFIYKNSKPIFWNTNTFVYPPDTFAFNSLTHYNDNTGFYVVYKLALNKQTNCLAFINIKSIEPISSEKNKKHFIASDDENDFGIEISTVNKKGAVPVRYKGNSLFYLEKKDDFFLINDSSGWRLLLNAIPFILFGISIHTYFKVIVKKTNPTKVYFLLWSLILAIRFLTYCFGFPTNYDEYTLFSPEIFASDQFNKSLGDLLINMALLFWALLFFAINVQGELKNKKIISKPFTGVIVLGLCSVINVALSYFIHTLINNSTINFDTTLISQINIFSVVGLLTILIIIANMFVLNLITHNYVKSCFEYKNTKFLIFLILFILIACTVDNAILLSVSYAGVSSMIYFLLHDSKYFKIKLDFNSYTLLLWFMLVSFLGAIYMSILIDRKEIEERKDFGEKLITVEDKKIENLLIQYKNQLSYDKDLEKIFNSNETISENEIVKYFYKDFVTTHFLNYKKTLHFKVAPTYNLNKSIDYFNAVNNLKKASPNLSNFNIDSSICQFQSFNEKGYILNFHLYINKKLLGYFYLKLSKKNNVVEKDYSDFLYSNGHRNKVKEYNYSIAIYQDSIFEYRIGNMPFPYRLSKSDYSNFLDKDNFKITKNGITSVWYRSLDKNKIIIIAKQNNFFYLNSTLFAYFFLIYFAVMSIYIIANILVRSNLKYNRFINLLSLNLRLRIHTSILIVVLLSFIAVGYFTHGYLINRVKNKSYLEISNYSQLILFKINNYFLDINNNFQQNFSDIEKENFQSFFMEETSKFPKGVNIFSAVDGGLIYSSQPDFFYSNVVSDKIPFGVFNKLKNSNLEHILNKEKINDFNYVSMYCFAKNRKGERVAIIQLPYFSSEQEMKDETSKILITLINIYVFVFLVSSIIALFISNSVTKPFKYIVKQFTKINLEKTNEPLKWNNSDEIGLLVKEYNRMLRKLENSTMLLAKSEREMAWREMAKQVAHEIKNPLTPMKLSLQMLENAIKNKKDNVSEMTEKVAATIIEQIDNLTLIATNFSNFAKLPELKNEIISLNEILKSVTGMYMNDKKIEFLFSVPDFNVPVYADKSQLIRVFNNIIQNATQSIPNHRKGKVSLQVIKIENNFIRIIIADNGEGVSKEQANNLFKPYFTTKSSGTGLGLAMCKDIIEKFNGKISFESVENVGTKFLIDLPIYTV